ncbi:putative stress-induced transcription regulator [Murinocardiopsis flavida]|uniref:Putative stress-induced transcription regulator n=1 Tax=Murinocardiopsis flavida TaxID=645275 RepID=A0A2P8DLJ1_9ACTN|nr:ABATE domain-containing protein [Murinocardiopsis flavida]PSK98093.1 putative stress-induced transcription regulator [Murinocardiopsis flavida]
MSTPNDNANAAALIEAFAAPRAPLADRADLAQFLREHRLVTEGAIPITLADFDEAIALRDAIRVRLRTSGAAPGGPDDPADAEVLARGQRVLDGLRVTVRLAPDPDALSPLAPAVVDEVRRGLARVAGAWAVVLSTGQWVDIKV